MKRAALLIGLLLGGIVLPRVETAAAAERFVAPASVKPLPFPRSARAQAVWGEGGCWNACQSSCTWNFAACLRLNSQDRCLQQTDVCDRDCQRSCRTRGGPYLPTD